jgi:hypothetical protein
MTQHEASRTLVKSPPELWAECSDAASLSRHLSGSFGEIRITRLEPETAVAWEGERASGTVKLEPSGWGTKVILTARGGGEAQPRAVEPKPVAVELEAVAVEPEAVTVPQAEVVEPVAEREPAPADPPVRRGLMARLSRFLKPAPAPASGKIQLSALEPAPAPEPEPTPAPEPEPEHEPPPRAAPAAPWSPLEEALTAALESLGQAHHRPYSRA